MSKRSTRHGRGSAIRFVRSSRRIGVPGAYCIRRSRRRAHTRWRPGDRRRHVGFSCLHSSIKSVGDPAPRARRGPATSWAARAGNVSAHAVIVAIVLRRPRRAWRRPSGARPGPGTGRRTPGSGRTAAAGGGRTTLAGPCRASAAPASHPRPSGRARGDEACGGRPSRRESPNETETGRQPGTGRPIGGMEGAPERSGWRPAAGGVTFGAG